MTGWKITTWTPWPIWHGITNVTDFQKAVNERNKAITGSDLVTLKQVGDIVQGYKWIWTLQKWVEDNLNKFVVSHDNGTPRAAGYYDHAGSITTYSSLNDVMAAAGLGSRGWQDERKIQPGDYICAHHFYELQKALNVLVWVNQWGCSWTSNRQQGYGGVHLENEHWPDAKTACEHDWNDAGQTESNIEAYSRGWYWWKEYEIDDTDAWLYRSKGVCRAKSVGASDQSQVELYIYPTSAEIFDDNGDGWVPADMLKYHLIETVAQSSTAGGLIDVTGTTVIGGVAKPNWCPDPINYPRENVPPNTAVFAIEQGYWASIRGIARYNVTGGFTYQ